MDQKYLFEFISFNALTHAHILGVPKKFKSLQKTWVGFGSRQTNKIDFKITFHIMKTILT